MKVWHVSYSWHGGWGAYQEYELIVVAEIESKAIGMAVMEYPDTAPCNWSAVEITTNKERVYLQRACSSCQ